MSCEEDGDESEYNPDQDEESSSDESSDKFSDHEVVRGDSDEEIVEEESANINVNKSDQSKKKKRPSKARIKKECPVPYCHKIVVHLPRHLRKVHDWPKHQARAAVLRFNLRKKYSFSTAESAAAGNRKGKTNADEHGQKRCNKDYHKKRCCPMVGCSAVVKRLPSHLQTVHGFSPKSSKYKALLSKALPQPKRPYSVQMIEKRAAAIKKIELEPPMPDIPVVDTVGNDEDEEMDLEDFEQTETSSTCDDVILIEDDVDSSESPDPEVLVMLANWLQSPDGGKKDEKTAKQHVSQIKNILSLIDAERRVMSLFDCSLLNEKFVKYAEQKYVPQTIKSYFMSLRHFYSYVLAEKPVIDATTELVTQMMEKVKRWSSSYKRSSQKRKWEKMEEDRVELVTPEKIQQFERSQAARDAVILLGKMSGAHSIEITQSQYTLLRDFLLVQISIDNANRAGVLSNMTVEEFERGYKEDDRFIMNVMKHKTFHVHGPAQVILTGNLQNWISIFIKQVRSKLPYITAEKEQPLFPSWNGKKLESGQISKAIQSVWKKAGIAGPIHSTLFRKGAVTVCHSSQKEMTSDLADLMAHKEDTAKRYRVLYYLLLAFQSVYYFVWNKFLDFRFSNLLWPLGTCTCIYIVLG